MPVQFASDREYKREVIPVPLTTKPKVGEKYFVPQLSTGTHMYAWTNNAEDNYLLRNKLVFATAEEAAIEAKSIIDFLHKTL